MMEIFLTAVCLVSSITVIAYFHYAAIPLIIQILNDQETHKEVVYRSLLKMPTKEEVDSAISQSRRDIITQMGDLSTKHDFCKLMDNVDQLSALRSKLKEDRFKNMREAFGGKKEEE